MARAKTAITRLAEKLDISRMTVWRWLEGERNASKSSAKAIVEALGGDSEDLSQLEIWRSDGRQNSAHRVRQVDQWYTRTYAQNQ